MSLPVAIAVIALADVALLGLLAFVMSRARLLAPHVSGAVRASETRLARETHVHAARRAAHREHVRAQGAGALAARA